MVGESGMKPIKEVVGYLLNPWPATIQVGDITCTQIASKPFLLSSKILVSRKERRLTLRPWCSDTKRHVFNGCHDTTKLTSRHGPLVFSIITWHQREYLTVLSPLILVVAIRSHMC